MENLSQREVMSRIERLEERIERYPIGALGIAALAGFVLAGGLRSKTGLTLLAFAGRMALRETTLGLVRNTLSGDGHRREPRTTTAGATAAAFD
jgi:hypothetical protein